LSKKENGCCIDHEKSRHEQQEADAKNLGLIQRVARDYGVQG
jgi:hypothetical protein